MNHLRQTAAEFLAAALTAGLLTGCGSRTDSSPEIASAAKTVSGIVGDGIDLSDGNYDFQAEFFYSDYNAASNADADRQDGINTFGDTDIVFKSLYYDKLLYLLEQEGSYLILFSGSWCHNSRAAIGYINEYAKAYGIDTVYTFDFRLDGETRDTHIRESALTFEYGGENVTAADWNYLYGELIDQYLTNLNDWVEYKEDGENALTWYNADYNDGTIAKVQVPFLFLYNKENAVHYVPVCDENGKQTGIETIESDGGFYPIVCGFEEMVDKDSIGVYDSTSEDGIRNYITDEYTIRLESIFTFMKENSIDVREYTDEDYLCDAFVAGNGRGHSEKLYDIFSEGEQINIRVIPYRQLKWLLEQEGSAVLLFGGAWCANTQASIGLTNDYAVANNIIIYMMDFRLDGKYPIDFWGYDRDRQFQIRSTLQEGNAQVLTDSTFVGKANPFACLYTNLVNRFLTNINTITDILADDYCITSMDADGNEDQAARMQAPYLLAYNKNAIDEDGFAAPILAWHEEMLEVTEKSLEKGIYFYQTENYASYSTGIEEVLTAYAESVGRTYIAYTGEPREELLTSPHLSTAAN